MGRRQVHVRSVCLYFVFEKSTFMLDTTVMQRLGGNWGRLENYSWDVQA